MLKKLAGIVLLLGVALSPLWARGHENQKDPVLSARECKMLLKSERFADRQTGAAELLKLVKSACVQTGLPFTPSGLFNEESVRLISFLDTAKFDLYRQGYVLRRRQDAELGRSQQVRPTRKKFELTFKFRHPEPTVAIEHSTQAHNGFQSKESFEENLLVKESTIDRVYDRSTKVELKMYPGENLGGFAQVFPDLLRLGIVAAAPIVRVNDIEVVEFQRELGTIDLGMNVKAKAVVSVWYRGQETKPLIAEFSFKSKLVSRDRLNSLINHTRRRSDDLLRELQKAGAAWIAVGATKTGLIYQSTSGHQD